MTTGTRPEPLPGARLAGTGVGGAHCGIVRRCVELPLEPGDPRVFCFVAEAGDTRRFGSGTPEAARFGCGTGLTREWAAAAAVGEVVERYSPALYDPDQIRHASFDELDEEAIPPLSFALYSERQYAEFARRGVDPAGWGPPRPFTAATRTGWVRGWKLADGSPVLVPAPFVYFPYLYEHGEPYLAESASTGLACARTVEEAALRALCEVVERDAVAIVWYGSLSLPRLALGRDDALGRLYRERFARPGVQYVLIDATLDLPIPTVLAAFIDERGGTAVAAATRPTRFDAARKALLEAAQCRIAWKRELVAGPPERFAADFHDVTGFHHHSRVYALREMRPRLEFLWSSDAEERLGGEDAPREDPAALLRCVGVLRRAGLEPAAVDVTSPDVREAGYRVVRVVVPGLQPLAARHDAPYLGGRRLREVPWRIASRARPLDEEDLNRFVHPFP